MAFDGEKFGKEIVSIVRDFVHRQVQPLEERIAALEAEAGIAKAAKATVRVRATGRPL